MINSVTLLGRVGRIETKEANGKSMTTFSIATDSGSGEHKKTDWHNCVAFKKTGEILGQHVKVGDLLCVEGRISYSKYTPKGAEKEVTSASVLVDRFSFINNKKEANQTETSTSIKDDEYSSKVKSAFASFGANPKPNVVENLNFAIDDVPF